MVAGRRGSQPGTVSDLVNQLLDRGYNSTVEPVLNAVARSTNSGVVQQRLAELEAEAARLAAAGERLAPGNPVLRALLADLDDVLRGDAQLINGAAEPLQTSAVNAAGTIQRQLALPGMTDQQLLRIGVRWNQPDPAAVAQLVTYSQSEGWAQTINQYSTSILEVVNNQAIRGMALGWNPTRTAREIIRIIQALPRHQANNLMRTMQLTSYRDSTAAHQQANSHLANQIVRIAALDERTCLSCVAQHGDVIWDSERDDGAPVPRVNDHHSGRCTSVMIVRGRARNIVRGEDWWSGLTPERQAQQLSLVRSPGKLEALQAGQVVLRDFVQAYRDPAFGEMLREASLSGALSMRGAS